ncbi:MAG: bacterial Ig-like domain-containing protein [Clostridia bacterium]|nr:bacterial Ig-like domain-containing protein [Clostridia bacterium]
MTNNRIPKLLCCLLILVFTASLAALPAAAVTDQDKAQISVTVSENNPEINEIVTVTVSIDNYPTMSPRISAMYISVSFDTNCFEYVPDSATSVLKTNTNDITSVSYDESETVSFAYVYANSKKSTLPTTARNIFTFKLKVRSTVEAKTLTSFTVNELTLYNGKDDSRYTLIECKTPNVDEVTVWQKRPVILINGNNDYAAVYAEDVTLTFDTPNAQLSYEGRAAETITSPYNCDKNGRYTVTVKVNGQNVSLSFEISKEISNISVKAGTYKTEYALGVTPDYSGWVLLVTYRDGSHSEISMDDPDVVITGYQPNSAGSQRILIKYKNQSTSVNVTVTQKSVESVTIKSNVIKNEYLVGDDIDPAGGVLLVFYDDRTYEDVPMTAGMLSGYDKSYVGEQTVTVTYGNLAQQFRVTYYSREAADALNNEISELVSNPITLESKDTIVDLFNKYQKLNKTQQNAVTLYPQLKEARVIYNNLATGANTKPAETKSTNTEPVSTKPVEAEPGSDLKIVWYIVAGIVIVSVIGGIIYFLYIYFKKKKELDEDEYYYDEEDDEDDGDLSYDDSEDADEKEEDEDDE